MRARAPSGTFEDGRGGFRTCDLSRVKRGGRGQFCWTEQGFSRRRDRARRAGIAAICGQLPEVLAEAGRRLPKPAPGGDIAVVGPTRCVQVSLAEPDSLERLMTDAARGPDGTVRLLSVAQLAKIIGKKPGWVYRNARWLGAVRLGPGPKAPLAFDPRTVAGRLAGTQSLANERRRADRLGADEQPASAPRRARRRDDLLVAGSQAQLLVARDRWSSARATDARRS